MEEGRDARVMVVHQMLLTYWLLHQLTAVSKNNVSHQSHVHVTDLISKNATYLSKGRHIYAVLIQLCLHSTNLLLYNIIIKYYLRVIITSERGFPD